MSTRPTLHSFIDEELLRAPMVIDIVIDAVLAQWRVRPPPASRHDGDAVRVLTRLRNEVAGAALGRLRELAQAELQQLAGGRSVEPTRPAALSRETELSLIGEDDVAVDVEIARCIQIAKLTAEVELRTLQTYTSALVDDRNVARETNPFRPERFVRALAVGAQALPLSRPVLAAFLRQAAEPLAEGLKRSYQAGWQRLADQGVTPASHRTIVAGGGNWGDTSARYRPPEGLDTLRDSLPSRLGSLAPSLQLPASAIDSPAAGARQRPAPQRWTGEPPPPAPATEPQLIDLLNRLFETMRRDFGLPPEASAFLQQLQPAAQGLALRDPALLDSYDHPLWRFMNQVVHDLQTGAPAQCLRLVGLARNLVAHLSGGQAIEPQGYGWALERVQAAQRHALALAQTAAAPAIARLQRRLCADAPATTSTMPLDIASLDTVPADLMTEPAKARSATALLAAGGLHPGAQLRVWLQGDWRMLTTLWQDDGHELALLLDPAADRLWALRQGALARLMNEGLAQPLRVRSLVRRAADRVLRGL